MRILSTLIISSLLSAGTAMAADSEAPLSLRPTESESFVDDLFNGQEDELDQEAYSEETNQLGDSETPVESFQRYYPNPRTRYLCLIRYRRCLRSYYPPVRFRAQYCRRMYNRCLRVYYPPYRGRNSVEQPADVQN